jgi:hypothetical protein
MAINWSATLGPRRKYTPPREYRYQRTPLPDAPNYSSMAGALGAGLDVAFGGSSQEREEREPFDFTPNQLASRWEKFQENYKYENPPSEQNLKDPKAQKAYQKKMETAFLKEMDRTGELYALTGQGEAKQGGAKAKSTGQASQRQAGSYYGEFQRRLFGGPEPGADAGFDDPYGVFGDAQQGSGSAKAGAETKKGQQRKDQGAGQQQGPSQPQKKQSGDKQAGTQKSIKARTLPDKDQKQGRESTSDVTPNAARSLSKLGPDVGQPSQGQGQGQTRQKVGFFSGGQEGMQHRRDVMQGWADQAVDYVQDLPRTIAQAPEKIAQAFAQRDTQGKRGTGRDPIGNWVGQNYMDAVEAQGDKQQVYANAREAISENPADRVLGEFGQAIAKSYMNAATDQGQRPQIGPDQVPNLTAKLIQDTFNGSQEAYRTLLDAMDDLVGDISEAPQAAQGMLRSLASMADQVGVDLSQVDPNQIVGLVQQLFEGQEGPPNEMFQRQSNMQGPATWGTHTMPTPTSGPQTRTARSNIGVPSLREFDAE